MTVLHVDTADATLIRLADYLTERAWGLADRILVAPDDEGIVLLDELDETVADLRLVQAMLLVSR